MLDFFIYFKLVLVAFIYYTLFFACICFYVRFILFLYFVTSQHNVQPMCLEAATCQILKIAYCLCNKTHYYHFVHFSSKWLQFVFNEYSYNAWRAYINTERWSIVTNRILSSFCAYTCIFIPGLSNENTSYSQVTEMPDKLRSGLSNENTCSQDTETPENLRSSLFNENTSYSHVTEMPE